MDADPEVSSYLLATPTVRRLFAREVDMAPASHEASKVLERINQDGSLGHQQT
jgi:hypothetical protein